MLNITDEIERQLSRFTHKHLPPHLAEVSRPFCELAETTADGPANFDTLMALHALMTAKDNAVRAIL